MIFISLPPTRERYLAEIRNLLGFRCRPFYIMGKPRASFCELKQALKGVAIGKNALRVGNSTVEISSKGTYVY